jgi:NAD(P)-dependent dehydrogenase (short-subunit alcohol dehydrogenase family)
MIPAGAGNGVARGASTAEGRAVRGRLDEKVAIVTGAGSGIGKATALRFAEEGARVTCVDINGDAVSATAHEIGDAAFAVTADIADAEQVRAYTDETVARWGKLDVVFNNAGVNLPGVFHEASDEVIDRTLNVNVKGTMYGCRYAIPYMLRAGGGSLINTTSVNGLVAEPFLAVYAASKGAIVMLSKGIALDYAKQGIRCNAIAPGWVDTPINYAHAELLGGLQYVYDTIDSFQPIGRPGEPREIANVALFLASDESSFVTGTVVVADGGMTAK